MVKQTLKAFLKRSRAISKKAFEEQKTFNTILKAKKKIVRRKRMRFDRAIKQRIRSANRAFLDFD